MTTERHFGGIGRIVRAALVAAATISAAAPAVAKSPETGETVAFVSRELNRLCDDRRLSRFDRLDDRRVLRNCRARVEPGRLLIEVRYRSIVNTTATGGDGGRIGVIETAAGFDRATRFFCGETDSDGFAALFFSCTRDVSLEGRRCVRRSTKTIRRSDRSVSRRSALQPVAKLVELKPDSCGTLENALNYLAGRVRLNPEEDPVRDFFED